MSWQEVVIKSNRGAVDDVSDVLVDSGAGGASVEDPFLIREMIAENVWDAYDFSDEVLTRDHVLVRAYLPLDGKLAERLQEINLRLAVLDHVHGPETARVLTLTEVSEEDWANSWKVYYKPIKIGERVIIKPEWEEYRPKQGEVVVELDPGVAFGTGTHATTAMCIKFMEQVIHGGETVFDIGTGSGILSIAAAKLGAAKVKAVDIDEMATKAAAANVGLNQLNDRIEVMTGNLLDNVKGKADLVVANIVADVIIRVCPDAAAAVRIGGKFIASGIISSRQDDVVNHISRAGFTVLEVSKDGEWVCLLARKEA